MQQLPLKTLIFALILLGTCGLIPCAAVPAAAQGAKVWLDPATLELAPGEEGTLEIKVQNVVQLAGAEVHLTFDPALLEVVDAESSTEGTQITHGDFLSPDFVVQNAADPATGTVHYAIACMPLDKAVNGSGVLARITFRALGQGESLVSISGVLLADAQTQSITVETESSVVVVSRSGPSSPVWALIGLVAVAVTAGSVAVIWNAIKAHKSAY